MIMYFKKNFFVEKLSVFDCTSFEDMMILFNEGMKHKKLGSHAMNKDSSRSHTLFSIYVVKE